MTGITDLEVSMVEQYLTCYNVVKAGRLVGYSTDNASRVAWARPRVQNYKSERLAELAKETGIEQHRLIDELSAIAFSNIGDYITTMTDSSAGIAVDLTGMTRAQSAAMSSLEITKDGVVKFKLYDKMAALKLLGQQLHNMFINKEETNNPDGNLAPVVNVTIKKE